MVNLELLRLCCPTLQGFSGALSKIQQALPPELRPGFADLLANYFLSFGIQGTYERLNNRSVAQILAEFQPGKPDVIASGQVDGVRYELADRAAPPWKDNDKKADE